MNLYVGEEDMQKLLTVAELAGLDDLVFQIKEAHPDMEPFIAIPATEKIIIDGEYEDVAFHIEFKE